MCILVDCDWGRKNREVSDAFGVQGYPTVVFAGPDGKVLDRLKRRDSASVLAQIGEIAGKFPPGK